jgi:hypothetical protein
MSRQARLRTPLTALVAAVMFVQADLSSQTATARIPGQTDEATERGELPEGSVTPKLVGSWRSAAERLKLATDFDKSIWGPNASSVRTADLTIRASGESTLTVTRRVVDARGRTAPGSTSLEEAQIRIGAPQQPRGTRVNHDVKVVRAERSYPDDPAVRWPIEGLRVQVVTVEDVGNTLELRFETPEGTGSFWETLRREVRRSSPRTSPASPVEAPR